VTPQHAGRPDATKAPSTDGLPDARTMDFTVEGRARPPSATARPNAELDAILEPMLGAIVRLANATAGTVRASGLDGGYFEPVIAIGLQGRIGRGAGALQSWCGVCAESRDVDSVCVKSDLCGHEHIDRS